MKRLLICFFVLGIRFISCNNCTTEGTSTIFCQYIGQSWVNNYTFNIDDLQNSLSRCQNVVFAQYNFVKATTVNTHVWESDKNAIRSLVKSGISTYIMIGFSDPTQWLEVLEPQDDVLFNHHVNGLVAFVKKYNISGVITDFTLDVFKPTSTYTVDSIISFVSKIKSGAESLKFGMTVNGIWYQSYSDSKMFDISRMNTVMDHYVIDMTVLNVCTATIRNESLNPVTSQNSTLTTIEQVSVAVNKSPMDKCKVIAMLLIGTADTIEDIMAYNEPDVFGTYSELCTAANNGEEIASKLCFASTPILYNQGKFVRDYFNGIMLNVVEADDIDCVCKCSRSFVATNSIIDGWECGELQTCPGIDNLLS